MKLLLTYEVTADTRAEQAVDEVALAYTKVLRLRFDPEAAKADIEALPSVTSCVLVSVVRPLELLK